MNSPFLASTSKWDTHNMRMAEELPSDGVAITLHNLVVIIRLGLGQCSHNLAGSEMSDLVAESVLRPQGHVPNYPGPLTRIFGGLKLICREF